MDYAEFAHDVRTKIRNIYDATDPESPTVSSNIVCKKCKKPQIKPATVLMGTQLPPRTFECLMEDFNSRESNVDLMIIAGTSLTVQPAAGWVVGVPPGIITYTPNTSFQPHTVCTTDTLSIPSHPHPKKENDC